MSIMGRKPLRLFAGVALGFAGALSLCRRGPVGATGLERTRLLPGDDLIPDPMASLTHAITVRCPRREL